jgi:hypothetical protein
MNNPTFPCATTKPAINTTVRIFLGDAGTAAGHWTGKFWWSNGREVDPIEWQDFGFGSSPRDVSSTIAEDEEFRDCSKGVA